MLQVNYDICSSNSSAMIIPSFPLRLERSIIHNRLTQRIANAVAMNIAIACGNAAYVACCKQYIIINPAVARGICLTSYCMILAYKTEIIIPMMLPTASANTVSYSKYRNAVTHESSRYTPIMLYHVVRTNWVRMKCAESIKSVSLIYVNTRLIVIEYAGK